jgi:DNA-binding transcriptional LysR family regulator
MQPGTARFDLTDLRLFLTIIEHGSITRGAEAMNLAVASASERVSGMETALGAPLFERTSRGVRATAAGDALVRHARLIVDQAEQMRGDLRRYATGLKGRVRLLSNTAALCGFLPRELCRFLVDHPDLSVDVEELPSAEIVLAIADGRADLGLVADVTDLSALETRLIAEDRLLLIANRTHRLGRKRSVQLANLKREPLVSLSDAALEIYLAERLSRLGVQVNPRIRLRTVAAVGAFVKAGVGIAILSEASLSELKGLDLAAVPLSDLWAFRRIHLCARDFSKLTPHARLLANQLTITADTCHPTSTRHPRAGESQTRRAIVARK